MLDADLTALENDAVEEYTPELVALRNHVLFIHTTIESILHSMILKNVVGSDYRNVIKMALGLLKIGPLLNRSEYLPLVEACIELNLIESKEGEKIKGVNNHRRCFAHPNGYKKQMDKYRKDKEFYLETQRRLVSALKVVLNANDRLNKKLDKK